MSVLGPEGCAACVVVIADAVDCSCDLVSWLSAMRGTVLAHNYMAMVADVFLGSAWQMRCYGCMC